MWTNGICILKGRSAEAPMEHISVCPESYFRISKHLVELQSMSWTYKGTFLWLNSSAWKDEMKWNSPSHSPKGLYTASSGLPQKPTVEFVLAFKQIKSWQQFQLNLIWQLTESMYLRKRLLWYPEVNTLGSHRRSLCPRILFRERNNLARGASSFTTFKNSPSGD